MASAQHLIDKRQHILAASEEVTQALAIVPHDGGSFWRSKAERQYAARIAELRGYLSCASEQLGEALGQLNAAVSIALQSGGAGG